MVKIERSYPAPVSLAIEKEKVNGSYSESDVVQQLLKDFHNKCYICEMKELQDPQIEHLVPHKNGKYKDRKFDWGNLFLSCGHCNGVKNQSKYEEGILDCCKEDPEKMISFKIKENPSSRIVVRKLKVLLKRKSAFAGFKRCFVREHCNEYPELAQFIA